MGKRIFAFVACVLIVSSAFAVTTKDLAAGLTAADLAKILAGPGVTITNAKVTGAPNAIGSFTGGSGDGLAIDAGVILSSGDIKTAAGPNTSEGTSGSLGQPGDADLDSLVAPYKTHDAVVLEFDATTVSSKFAIRYVFASEEYKEYVGSKFNDVFAFLIDGQNIALVPGTVQPVAVNTINHKLNSAFYNDNPAGSNAFGTSFDGFTSELVAVGSVTPGTTHHIRLAIADASDSILDSAVFLAQGGISGSGASTTVVPDLRELLLSNLDDNEMNVTVYGVPDEVKCEMSTAGLPEDSLVTLDEIEPLGPNTPVYRMHIKIGAATLSGAYNLAIRAGVADSEAFGIVRVIVDCQPPMILGTPGHQPASTKVTKGTSATLKVDPSGTAAFRYQWYAGHTGSTRFPVAGATSATLTTPPVNSTAEYWVRVFSPCGTVDSRSAVVSTK